MPITLLTDCHDRIRTFLGGLDALCGLADPADPRAAPTATRIARYLREGLPLHAQDEDQSLGPVLAALHPEAAPLLDDLAADHAHIEAALPPLLTALGAIAAGQAVDAPRLKPLADAVSVPLRAHIAREEAELFPLVATLDDATATRLRAEFRARRAG